VRTLKRFGGWKSDTVVGGYVENSLQNKIGIAKKILGNGSISPTSIVNHEITIVEQNKEAGFDADKKNQHLSFVIISTRKVDVGMADVEVNRLTLLCPRDCQSQDDILKIFQKVTPPNCPFRPTKIWSRQTKKNTCLWCVLYTIVDPRIQYLTGTQARELRAELN
jgi:hypothetical protein